MHHVQKKAVLALVSMLESGLREIRQILADGGSSGGEVTAFSPRAGLSPAPGSPLSDKEEEDLDALMEKNRLAMVRQAESAAKRFYEDAEPKLADFFDEEPL